MKKQVKLGNKLVGEGQPVYIVAEGGLTNWGDLKLAKKQVDAAVAAGCDAVKFQAQTTEHLVSKKVSPYWYKRLKYKELSHDDLKKLWKYCQVRNIECFITAHTDIDLEFLDKELNVPFFKVGSGESINYDFLKNVGSRKKPVIMSLGLHLSEEEILKSVKTLERVGATDIVVLHCYTVYPTPPEMNSLLAIPRLKSILNWPIGYSDHTVGWHFPLAAVAMGAKLIEKHISFDKSDKRSFDCPGSCLPEELKMMVEQIRQVEMALKPQTKEGFNKIKKARQWAQQSIEAARDIKKGERITRSLVMFKRPGPLSSGGLSPEEFSKIENKIAKRDISKDEPIITEDVSQ